MKKTLLILISSVLVSAAMAKPLVVSEDANMSSILNDYKDKIVTLNLKSGSSVSGKVGIVNKNLVHIKRIRGMEFYDSVTDVNSVESIVVRTKD